MGFERKASGRLDSPVRLALTHLLLVLPASVCAAGGAPLWARGTVRRSADRGKRGSYRRDTKNPRYKYFVYVPASYSEENPAGLHIFFHGQGCQDGAPSFKRWAKHLLEPYNLIGINMQYLDGDNRADTQGKVAAAEEAIAQTVADYKVIVGRGVISCFSGGGLPHAGLFARYGRKSPSRRAWPFNHSSLYGANFLQGASGGVPMSWFLGVKTGEWNMGGPTLGTTQPARTAELLSEAAKGGSPDVYLKVSKIDKHTLSDEDVAASARLFGRSDLAFSPFLYAPDFRESRLKPTVAAANGLVLGRAASSVKQLLSSARDEELKKKAALIKHKIDERANAVLALTRELAEKDAVLCNYYGKIFSRQMMTHPRSKELRAILLSAKKNRSYQGSLSAFLVFSRNFGKLFKGSARVNPEMVPLLEQIVKVAGEESLLGTMASEYLQLR